MTAPANLRGWGQGWPVNRSGDMATVRAARSGTSFTVHKLIAPIIKYLIDETERRGYLLDHGPGDQDDDWSYDNRPIRGKRVASNHSWGLAVDIDATQFGLGSRKRLPQWIVDLWHAHGFDYGGDYRGRKDPMHFEFNGWPSDARRIAAQVAGRPAPGPTPPPFNPPTPPPPPPHDQGEGGHTATDVRPPTKGPKHWGRVEAVTAMHRRWVPPEEFKLFSFLQGHLIECPTVATYNQWTSNKQPIGSNPINGPL